MQWDVHDIDLDLDLEVETRLAPLTIVSRGR